MGDTVDKNMAAKLFATVEKIRQSHNKGKFDNSDSNFFYDYLALLGTMQNQHFFNQKQTENMLHWIKEVVDDYVGGASSNGKGSTKDKKKEKSKEKEEPASKGGKAGKAKGAAKEPEPKPKGKGKGKGDSAKAKGKGSSDGGGSKGKGKSGK